jgi:hypothetical protein
MRHLLNCLVLVAAGLSFVLLPSTPAEAGVRWGKCGAATRISGKGVECANGFSYPFSVSKAGETWVASVMTPYNQCAPLRFTLEVDGKKVGRTAALAAGKSETVVLGKDLTPGPHVLTVKSMFMFAECYPEDPPVNPGNWGVDTKISVKP